MQRLIDAALELMSNPDAGDLTVQNVAERAGLSLRAFYHHFPSKDDLLLAVFEEAIQTTARSLDQEVAASADPLERLRIFTTEYYRTCRTGRTRALGPTAPGAEPRPVRVPAALRPPPGSGARLCPARVFAPTTAR